MGDLVGYKEITNIEKNVLDVKKQQEKDREEARKEAADIRKRQDHPAKNRNSHHDIELLKKFFLLYCKMTGQSNAVVTKNFARIVIHNSKGEKVIFGWTEKNMIHNPIHIKSNNNPTDNNSDH